MTGPLAAYPMNGIELDLYDGSFHEVDSSEVAFKIAGSMAFQDACKTARPVLLEPVMAVEVVTPEEYMGDVIGDLTSRRGRVQSMEARGNAQVVSCKVPRSRPRGSCRRRGPARCRSSDRRPADRSPSPP